jgi:hypothetical protein
MAAASAVSNVFVFPAMDSTAILMLFLMLQINIHFMHSFRVSSCESFSICSVYLVLSFLSNPYQAVLQRSKKSLELSFCLCCKAAMSLNFCVSLTTQNVPVKAAAAASSWPQMPAFHVGVGEPN